jgi:hypothetical protein
VLLTVQTKVVADDIPLLPLARVDPPWQAVGAEVRRRGVARVVRQLPSDGSEDCPQVVLHPLTDRVANHEVPCVPCVCFVCVCVGGGGGDVQNIVSTTVGAVICEVFNCPG